MTEAGQEPSPEAAMEQHVADTREEAIKAVREAIASEPAPEDDPSAPPAGKSSDVASDAAPERGKDGKFLPKDGKASKEKTGTPTEAAASTNDEEVSNTKVARLLREREERNEQRQQLRQEREAFERERQEFASEREQIKKDREWLAKLRTDPKLAVREAHAAYGDQWSPEEFIMSLAKDGTAEGALQRELGSTKAELAEIKRMIAGYTEQENKLREEANQRHAQQSTQATEKQFVGVAMNAEKYPHLFDQYEGEEDLLIARAHKVGQAYHAKTGEWSTHDEIAEFLDGERKSRIQKRQSSQKPESAAGQAPQPRASGSRTITTASASERRTVSRSSDEEMTEEDRREAAIAATRQAIRSFGAH